MGEGAKPPKDTFWRDLGLYSTLGLNMGLTVVAGLVVGLRLDKQFGTGARWTLAGIFLGLGIGLYTMFAVAGRVSKKRE